MRKKNLFSGITKEERLHEYIKIGKKFMEDSGTGTCHLWSPNHGHAHTFVLFEVLTALQELCASWAISRKGKKSPTTGLNIFHWKFFLTENNKRVCS